MPDEKNHLPEDIVGDRSSPGNYVLNKKDRRFCLTGNEQGSLKKSELKSRIENKRIQALPRRFQDLFDDIALIEYSETEFLSPDEEDRLWKEILNIKSRAAATLGYNPLVTPDEQRSNEAQFGLELGALIKTILPSSTTKYERKDGSTLEINHNINTDLVWGFILGLYSRPSEEHAVEAHKINLIKDEILNNIEHRSEIIKDSQEKYEWRKEVEDTIETRIRDVLQNQGISVDEPPISEADIMRWNGLSTYPFKKDEIENAINELFDIDQLRKLVELRQIVEDDGDTVLNKTWRGEKAKHIIREIWYLSKPDDMGSININDLNTISNYNPSKALINRLSSTSKHELHTNYPVINQKNNRCELTNYGELVSHCLFNKDCEFKWIERYDLFKQASSVLEESYKWLEYQKTSDIDRDILEKAISEIDIAVSISSE